MAFFRLKIAFASSSRGAYRGASEYVYIYMVNNNYYFFIVKEG